MRSADENTVECRPQTDKLRSLACVWAQTNTPAEACHPQMPSEGLSDAWLQIAFLLELDYANARLARGHVYVSVFWVAPLVQCYLFGGGAFVFYVVLRVAGHRLNHRMSSFNAFPVEEPIEQVPLHK